MCQRSVDIDVYHPNLQRKLGTIRYNRRMSSVNRDIVLTANVDNDMDRACDKRGRIETTNKLFIRIRMKQLVIFRHIMRKESLQNVTPRGTHR